MRLPPCPRRKSAAAHAVRTRFTSLQRRTGSSDRSRSVTGPTETRIRRKVFGKTKQEVRGRLQALHQELNAGVRSSSTYTVREAVDDWLREGLDGTSERTWTLYEGLLEPVLEVIGARPLATWARVMSDRS